jgi:TonB family protein
MANSLYILILLSITCFANSSGDKLCGSQSNDFPIVTQWVKPAYPAIAAARNINGTVLIDVGIDMSGIVRKTSVVSGPSLLRKPAKEAAMRWRFNRLQAGAGLRSARLVFIFRPTSYVPKESESDFTPPYQIAVVRVAMTGSNRK